MDGAFFLLASSAKIGFFVTAMVRASCWPPTPVIGARSVSASISRSTVLKPSYALGAAFQRGGWFWKRLSRTFMPSMKVTEAILRSG
jgi:hypothetical protein